MTVESNELNATSFARSATVVWNRSDVFDQLNRNSSCLQSSNSRFATRARTFDSNFDLLNTKLCSFFSGLLCCQLARKRCALSRALESAGTSTCPAKGITLSVSDRNSRVVESCFHVSNRGSDVSSNFASLVLNRSTGICCCLGHSGTVPSNRNADNTCVRNGSFAERTNRNPKTDCGNNASELRNYRKSLTPFLPATVLRGPLRVRELVRVRWPRTGKLCL